MKITVLVKDNGKGNWCVNELKTAAKKRGVRLDMIDFNNVYDAQTFSDWGEVVISRSTLLNKIKERPFIAGGIQRSGSFMMNKVLLEDPLVSFKSFQQKIVRDYAVSAKDADFRGIETFQPVCREDLLNLIKKKKLRFPFIEKPDFGAHGNGVRKIEKVEDVGTLQGNVYQNFVRNDGDFRVLCLGGIALGVIKRVATADDFRNNISQGGSVEVVQSAEMVEKISKVALKAAAVFNLDFCGVDVIYDQENDRYLFLEINTHPWWQGFQSKVEVNVADEIIKYCVSLSDRKKRNTYDLVKRYYQDNFDFLGESRFHFASRMYLFLDDKNSKRALKKLQKEYIGLSFEETEQRVKELYGPCDNHSGANEKELRLPLFEKYPMLRTYNRSLFKVMFAETVYGKDIRSVVSNYSDEDDMLALKKRLEKSDRDMAILSTHAINFIYNLESYLSKDSRKGRFIDPRKYYEIAKNAYTGTLKDKHNLRIYFLTHCILGESRFYSRKITRDKNVYLQMIKLGEEIIGENFFDVNLDNKLEFLVCAKILGYESHLAAIIFSEAQKSLCDGNYLVDVHNREAVIKSKNGLKTAEHRNVLFLMAFGRSPRFENM